MNALYALSLVLSLFADQAVGSSREARRVEARRPDDFVNATDFARDLRVDLMYFTGDNFVGRPIRGYRANRCLLVKAAAEALARAEAKVKAAGRARGKTYVLLARDCYRPQKATEDFLAWVADPRDQRQKERFYPGITKEEIVSRHYLSPFSGHSRGSTVDLTIAEVGADGTLLPLDMGGPVDFFGEVSHTDAPDLSAVARANRRLLREAMEPAFENYRAEWWHYSLRHEPYPRTAFDFDVTKDSK